MQRELRLEAIKALSLRGDCQPHISSLRCWQPHTKLRAPPTGHGGCVGGTPLHGYVNKAFDALLSAQRARPYVSARQAVDCDVALSETHRFAYLRCKKCAGSRIFHDYLANAFRVIRRSPRAGWPSGSTDSYYMKKVAKRKGFALQRTSRDFPWLSWSAVPDRVFREFFVFTFVRNPFDRAASAFQYCVDLNKAGSLTSEAKVSRAAAFAAHCRDPGSTNCLREHTQPMAPCVVDATTGRPLVDFVGHVETLTADLTTIVHEINRRLKISKPDTTPLPLPDAKELGISNAAVTRKKLDNPGIPSRRPPGSWQQTYYNGNASACEYLGRWPWSEDGCRLGFGFQR